METIILENENFKIFWNNKNGDSKGVQMQCKAVNPNDNLIYERYAGWIGISLALHSGVKTPTYIESKANSFISEHKENILKAIISFLNSNNKERRANEFLAENMRSAGTFINHKTSHPIGESQKQKVRSIMQKNAPIGTNHL